MNNSFMVRAMMKNTRLASWLIVSSTAVEPTTHCPKLGSKVSSPEDNPRVIAIAAYCCASGAKYRNYQKIKRYQEYHKSARWISPIIVWWRFSTSFKFLTCQFSTTSTSPNRASRPQRPLMLGILGQQKYYDTGMYM